jgi:hypothetical protein
MGSGGCARGWSTSSVSWQPVVSGVSVGKRAVSASGARLPSPKSASYCAACEAAMRWATKSREVFISSGFSSAPKIWA